MSSGSESEDTWCFLSRSQLQLVPTSGSGGSCSSFQIPGAKAVFGITLQIRSVPGALHPASHPVFTEIPRDHSFLPAAEAAAPRGVEVTYHPKRK